MNVPATLMAVLTTASIPLDPTYAVVELDTDWLPTDALVQVVICTCSQNLRFSKLKLLQPL